MAMHILVLLVFALILAPSIALAQRFALVIGIDAYTALPDLRKATNDARSVAASLEGLGLDVTLLVDADRRQISRAMSDMVSRTGPGDEVLFYFAGHGIQIDGRNFLIPADAPAAGPGDEAFLMAESIAVDQVMETLKSRGAETAVLILDACRDNPFPRNGTRSVGSGRGLAPVAAVQGSFILYSAGTGQTALDRLSDADADPNSVFTRNLLPYLRDPDRPLQEIARDLRARVEAQAASIGHSQRPAYYDELTGDYLLAAAKPPEPEVTPAAADPCAAAARDWEGVASLKDAGLLRAFAVAHFPCAELRNAALEQVALLEKGKVQPPPATREPPAPLATAPAPTAPALPATTPEPAPPLTTPPALLPPIPEGPDPEVILAAQTELKRLGCYRGAVDGDWGKGSRAALARFREIARLPAPPDVEEPTAETVALLKRPENAKCPAPPAPVAKARPAARTTTGAAAKPAAPAPAEAPAPKKKCGKLILLPFPAPIDMC
jgi:uncharacterized caspase-like protein